jgi:predicted MarR family transcription regulator
MDELEEIRAILIDALGGEDAVPEHATTVHLAHALRSQTGGYRSGLDSAARVCGKWANQLTAAIEEFDITEFRIVQVRDDLLRHSDREVSA